MAKHEYRRLKTYLNLHDTKPPLIGGMDTRGDFRGVAINFNFECRCATCPPFAGISVLIDQANAFVCLRQLGMAIVLNLAAETPNVLLVFRVQLLEKCFPFFSRADSLNLYQLSIHPVGKRGKFWLPLPKRILQFFKTQRKVRRKLCF